MNKLYLTGAWWLLALSTAQPQSPSLATKHFTLLDSWVERWSAGTVQQNDEPSGGKNFSIKVRVRTKKAAHLNLLYLVAKGQQLPIEAALGTARNFKGPYNKGHELLLTGRWESRARPAPPDAELMEHIRHHAQVEGWLCYSIKEKKYVMPIGRFEDRKAQQQNQ